jgi:hypothetical protein
MAGKEEVVVNSSNESHVFSETVAHCAQSLPLHDLISLANVIWNEVRTVNITDEDKLEDYYNQVHSKYKDFGSSFPIVLRWMVQIKKYSEKAFRKFLIKYSSAKIESKKDFLILQADYVVYIYKENKHHDRKNVEAYREFIIKQLLDEEAEMARIGEEYKQALKKMDEEKRLELYKELTGNKLTNNKI